MGKKGSYVMMDLITQDETSTSQNRSLNLQKCWGSFTFDPEKVKILVKEPKNYSRKILEVIHIRKNNPILNQDKGLELDPIWDRVLL